MIEKKGADFIKAGGIFIVSFIFFVSSLVFLKFKEEAHFNQPSSLFLMNLRLKAIEEAKRNNKSEYSFTIPSSLAAPLIMTYTTGNQESNPISPPNERIELWSKEKQFNSFKEQFEKEIGLLPNSKLYFLKRLKESINLIFLKGAKKIDYLLNLSQKRARESAILMGEGKKSYVLSTLSAYIKILRRIKKEELSNLNLDHVINIINENMTALQVVNLFSDKPEDKKIKEQLFLAMDLTSEISQKASELLDEKMGKVIRKDWIEGRVVEKQLCGDVIVIWEGKATIVYGLENADYLDENKNKVSQSCNDIKEGSIISVAPVERKVKIFYTEEELSKSPVVPEFVAQVQAEKVIIKSK